MSTPQIPLNAGFGPATTAQEVMRGIDLTGRIALVTGGYSGLGLETTRALAAAGASVVVPARTPDKAHRNLAALPRVELAALDLTDAESIAAFSQRFVSSGRPLHLLVNSAGVMATPLRRDRRGFESQFATNHLGHFQLVTQLWPALRKARGARVVALSSRGHQIGGFDIEDLNFERRPYDKWQAYAQSKTANALFAVALDVHGRADDVRAFSVHPGSILTDLARDLDASELEAFGVPSGSPHGYLPPGQSVAEGGDYRTAAQGAATGLWCATSPLLAGMGGTYCENCDIAPLNDGQIGRSGVLPGAIDGEVAERLWSASEALAGVRFDA